MTTTIEIVAESHPSHASSRTTGWQCQKAGYRMANLSRGCPRHNRNMGSGLVLAINRSVPISVTIHRTREQHFTTYCGLGLATSQMPPHTRDKLFPNWSKNSRCKVKRGMRRRAMSNSPSHPTFKSPCQHFVTMLLKRAVNIEVYVHQPGQGPPQLSEWQATYCIKTNSCFAQDAVGHTLEFSNDGFHRALVMP